MSALLAQHRATQEAEARRHREQADEERQHRRRELIQRAKASTGLLWRLKSGFTLTADVHARVLQAIERELATAAVDEWPWSEVLTIAEGVWARVCASADAEQREATRRAAEVAAQQRHAREAAAQQAREEQECTRAQWRREADQHAQRAARTRALTSYGQAYFAQALAEVGEVSPTERLALTWQVERALAAGAARAETEDDVADLVDGGLEREGGIVVDDDEVDEGVDEDWDDDQDEEDCEDDEDEDDEYDDEE